MKKSKNKLNSIDYSKINENNLGIYIDKTCGIPLHIQLADQLRKLIREEEIKDTKLTEGLMVKMLNLSRNTVRQAVATLVKEGWVIRKRSAGIKIVEKSSELIEERTHGLSFTESTIKMGKTPRVKGIVSKVINSPEFVIKIIPGINKDDKVFYTKRLRFIDEKPICIVEHFILTRFVQGISEKDFSEKGPMQSIHNILEKKYGINILKWQEKISVIKSSKADSKILEIPNNSPLLVRRATTFSTEGKIIYYSIHKFKSEYEIDNIIIFKERI